MDFRRIQQKLFFKSAPSNGSLRAVNPFLSHIVAQDPRWTCVTAICGGGEHHEEPTRIPTTAHVEHASNWFLRPDNMISIECENISVDNSLSETSHHSWRKMLVADPDCATEITGAFSLHYPSCTGRKCGACFFYREEITTKTIGDIVDVLEDLREHWVAGQSKWKPLSYDL